MIGQKIRERWQDIFLAALLITGCILSAELIEHQRFITKNFYEYYGTAVIMSESIKEGDLLGALRSYSISPADSRMAILRPLPLFLVAKPSQQLYFMSGAIMNAILLFILYLALKKTIGRDGALNISAFIMASFFFLELNVSFMPYIAYFLLSGILLLKLQGVLEHGMRAGHSIWLLVMLMFFTSKHSFMVIPLLSSYLILNNLIMDRQQVTEILKMFAIGSVAYLLINMPWFMNSGSDYLFFDTLRASYHSNMTSAYDRVGDHFLLYILLALIPAIFFASAKMLEKPFAYVINAGSGMKETFLLNFLSASHLLVSLSYLLPALAASALLDLRVFRNTGLDLMFFSALIFLFIRGKERFWISISLFCLFVWNLSVWAKFNDNTTYLPLLFPAIMLISLALHSLPWAGKKHSITLMAICLYFVLNVSGMMPYGSYELHGPNRIVPSLYSTFLPGATLQVVLPQGSRLHSEQVSYYRSDILDHRDYEKNLSHIDPRFKYRTVGFGVNATYSMCHDCVIQAHSNWTYLGRYDAQGFGVKHLFGDRVIDSFFRIGEDTSCFFDAMDFEEYCLSGMTEYISSSASDLIARYHECEDSLDQEACMDELLGPVPLHLDSKINVIENCIAQSVRYADICVEQSHEQEELKCLQLPAELRPFCGSLEDLFDKGT
jgi:hypothetical protein